MGMTGWGYLSAPSLSDVVAGVTQPPVTTPEREGSDKESRQIIGGAVMDVEEEASGYTTTIRIDETKLGAISFTYDATNGVYKIIRRLGCRRNEVAVEVEGKKVVRITTTERGDPTVHEVLMPEDVKLEHTAAAFSGGTLTVTVPDRAPGSFAGCALLPRRRQRLVKRTSILIT